MIEAVVFDMDGVLVDSEPVWERVRRAFTAAHGGRWAHDAQDRMMGMSTAEWSAYMSEDFGIPLPPAEIAERVIAAMKEEYRVHLPLLPGAVDAAFALASRWPLAVASSAPKSLIEAVLDASGMRPAFAAAVSSEEVTYGKPAPDVYLEAVPASGCFHRRVPPSKTPPTASAPPRPPAAPSSRSRVPSTRRPPTP